MKIGNLTVGDGLNDDENDERGGGDNGSDLESGEASNKNSGPWKKPEAAPQPETPPTEPEPVQPQSVQPQPAVKAVYKAPQMRNAPPPSERPMGRLRNKNIAPDISSEEYFPTLNSKQPASNDSSGAWGRKLVIFNYYFLNLLF